MQNSLFRAAIIFVLSTVLIIVATASVSAQTVTISNVDQGPYTPGSTIAVLFSIDNTSGCIGQNNTFNLYLSDASGSFASKTLIGSVNGFYASFINGTIPTTATAGTGYKVRIESTQPATISSASSSFTIVPGAAIKPVLNGQSISDMFPEVFGICNGVDNTNYSFSNVTATVTTSANITFYNELTKTTEYNGSMDASGGYTFSAKAANYTVTLKVSDGVNVATKAYLLLNNSVGTNIGTKNNNSVCLSGGAGNLSFYINPDDIKNNYPGNTYFISFGDGGTATLTQCDILQNNGLVSHTYKVSSCGVSSQNAFNVHLQSMNNYCGSVGTAVNTSAKVFESPYNIIQSPSAACTSTTVTFKNKSYPGQNPTSTDGSCLNSSALYTWYVDGQAKLFNASIAKDFTFTFSTPGIHIVTLQLQGNNTSCNIATAQDTICVSNAPKPAFTLPARVCLSSPVTPQDQSVTDNTCGIGTYTWNVTGPGKVTYAAGTSNSSTQPQFVFPVAGVYQVSLSISSAGCGLVTSPVSTIIVDSPPITKLSPDVSLCGNNQTLSFSTGSGPTQTTLTGTGQAQTDTYTWTVSGGNYTFANNTTANSQYPQIVFNDYATYTITVVQKNTCGTSTATQQISFKEAPTVSTNGDQHICYGNAATLQGQITGNVNSFQWVGGSGTFSDRNSLNTTYTPSAAEIAAGQVTVSLQAITSLPAPCNTIVSPVTIYIAPPVKITSSATANICTGQSLNYTITSSDPAATFTWTAAVTSGAASGFTASGSGNIINDAINATGNSNAVITYSITPSSASACPGQPFTFTVTASPLPTLTATAANSSICSNQPATITLSSNIAGTSYTWTSTVNGKIVGNSSQTTPVVATTINDMLTNNGTDAGSVTYIITPYNNGSCAGTPVTVTVNVQPLPVTANAGADEEVCNVTSYTLKGNSPSPGTGKWTVSSGQTGVTFSDDTRPDAVVSGLIPGNTYKFIWTITAASTCPASVSSVNIIDDKPSIGGTTAGSATLCAGTNSGSITLSGQSGNIIRWETSTNNGASWIPIANMSTTQSYSNLSQTTQYRAVIQSGSCSIAYSSVATVTVNAATIAANAGSNQNVCNATTITLNGNNPAPFTGIWTQTGGPPVTIVNPTNYQTQVTGLAGGNVYKFTWTIKGLAPCNDLPNEMTVNDAIDVTPSFTSKPLNGCGPLKVSFTNTSTSTVGATFLWDFGDGTQSSDVSPLHTFQPLTNGKDVTYHITLSVINNCNIHAPAIDSVVVSPATPTASILPNNLTGCAPFTVSAQNTSPGTNKQYDFYLYDGTKLVQQVTKTDKTDAVFTPITPTVTKTYMLYMVATNNCGTTAETKHIPITISPPDLTPQFFVQNNITKGCAPLTVTLVNNSAGGTQYYYNIYDVNGKLIKKLPAGTENLSYPFDQGDYSVTITAIDACTPLGLESAKTYFHVYAVPAPSFKANTVTGCKALTVTFSNTTPADATGTPASSLSYIWDFGDGSQSTAYIPEPHLYKVPGQFTVTLTAINNATQCSSTTTLSNYITVVAPPNVDFSVQPDTVISIPDYHFNFTDETTGSTPVVWEWNFGDGSISRSQNPSHTYADTGRYTVTLTVSDGKTCPATKTRHVRITGVPGQLFVPNAFTPDGLSTELRTFKAKGSGIKAYHLQIFNNWGQLVWETTELNSRGEPTAGWDGTFKGAPAPQGVYIWQMSATFINGTEWKGMTYNNSTPARTGPIHLIR